MMTKQEISALMQSVGGIVREYVADAVVKFANRLDEFDARIQAIPAGEKGDTGERGPAGESIRGEQGERGLSIVGPKGDTGERGERGEAGPAGLKGAVGEHGTIGDSGKDGRDGRDGISGKDGRDGERGRDALEIEILPMIDMSKIYPRGTFAKYAGGIMRALHNTNPQGPIIGDWEVVVEGIASLNIKQGSDPRSIVIDYGMTSGQRATETLFIPVPLFKGIFQDGTEYAKADMLQFGGSLWMVRAEKTLSKPDEQHADWQLIVRRGRDGKPGLNGKDGERGPEGARGKDLTQVDIGTGRKW